MVSFLVLFACAGGTDADLPVATVERGEFRHVLPIHGELKAVRSTTIAAPDLGGRSIKVSSIVEEGTRVGAGDVVVEFEALELMNTLEDAEARLETASTKILQKRAQLEVALADRKTEVTRAELELERARLRLTESETVPRVERESARIDEASYVLAVERSLAALESTRLEGEAELQLLRIEEKRSASQVALVREQLSQVRLTAPADGIVILPDVWKGGGSGPVRTGDTIWRGTTIMELPDMSEMQAEAWVHEVDAALVQQGQEVMVFIDAHPEPGWAGTVERVADLAVQRGNSLVKQLKVSVALKETAAIMKPGMTVRAEVLVGAVPDALMLPREAVFLVDGAPQVRVRSTLGGFDAVPVELGVRNDTHAIVTAGLEAGAVVALVDPDTWEPGEGRPAGTPSPADEES